MCFSSKQPVVAGAMFECLVWLNKKQTNKVISIQTTKHKLRKLQSALITAVAASHGIGMKSA